MAARNCCGGEVKFKAIEAVPVPPRAPRVPAPPVDYEVLARFDHTNLMPGKFGRRLNASLIDYEGGYLFAFRDGWAGSNVHICRLDLDLRPVSEPQKLALWHEAADYGREDPRIFRFGGRIYVNYVGVESAPRHPAGVVTNQLYARLSPKLTVEEIFYPQIRERRNWEKNHAYFEREGVLYAIYTVDPWNDTLTVSGNSASFTHRSHTPLPWSGGEQRGGAPPVRVGNEFWHFTHSRSSINGRPNYEIGLYTFESKPPFRPLRIIPDPIMVGTQVPQLADEPNYCDVIFVGGAVRREKDWLLSCGIHDRWCEIRGVAHAALEKRLIPVTVKPRGWTPMAARR